MLYLDTSLLVAALTNETETERIQRWLGQQAEDDLAISDWVVTEFSSALSIKLRAGHIEPAHRADALAMFARLTTDKFLVVPVAWLQFRTAARFADQHRLRLRAGDALHLTVRPSAPSTGGSPMLVRCSASRRCCFDLNRHSREKRESRATFRRSPRVREPDKIGIGRMQNIPALHC